MVRKLLCRLSLYGDKVIYSKYSGTEVKLDEDENLIIVKQSDILAIIE